MSVALALRLPPAAEAAACQVSEGAACQVSEGWWREWRFPEARASPATWTSWPATSSPRPCLAALLAPRRAATVSGATISGTVINQPVKKLWINYAGAQFIVIGDQQWVSSDGTSWTSTGTDTSPSRPFCRASCTQPGSTPSRQATSRPVMTRRTASPAPLQGRQLDQQPVRIPGRRPGLLHGRSLGRQGRRLSRQGRPRYSASAGGQGGAFGYTLDVTHVNDSSNAVAEPSTEPLPS